MGAPTHFRQSDEGDPYDDSCSTRDSGAPPWHRRHAVHDHSFTFPVYNLFWVLNELKMVHEEATLQHTDGLLLVPEGDRPRYP